MITYQNEHTTVFQSALYQTTSTVVLTKEMVFIVDPNWLPNEVDEIRNYVDSVKGDRDLYLLFTHGDFDHIIGYKAFPGAKTIGSYALSCHPKKDFKIALIQEFDRKHYINRNYPVEFPVLDIIISEDAEELRIGDTLLTFYKSPGHTPDGLFTVIEPLGIWITGDYLSDFELPFIYHSAQAYKETLNKASQILDQHSIELLVPGHGQVTINLAEMKRRLDMSSDHLERLIKAVIAKDEHAIAALGDEHAYKSSFTEECHAENIRIIAQEYSS
ncbi:MULTISPECIES: MBL fold metallo-hydrolase [unclassified Paenibacillus]|uniref:MBL fold metallo-hydrolase n=1 Tax=unclassified Paenibacillus TaxID=185978 RepID=UPI0027833A00|nr:MULTISPECIES: MBL fold metallo-hydrolase [unclassified Paenibacillus]MDQ0900471.1 hydroxyacylglutathione hydrolase [Paenibacillus sp. V4I7]MDQ0921019.1 hydroxyacylglutathione hydrolase [Paenibacillus sp. V4I5]